MEIKAIKGTRKRLELLLEDFINNGGNTTQFTNEFGLSNGYFNSKGDKELKPSTIKKICDAKPELNYDWLCYGIGNPWRPAEDIEEENAKDALKKVGRPYFDIDFLGGFDLVNMNTAEYAEDYISMEPYNKDGYFWCNLTGESMYPLIKSGSKICLRHIPEGVDGIIYGEVYAIVTKSEMRTVKWVSRADDEQNIRLIPENKDPKYGDYQDIAKDDILQLFKVVVSVNTF